MNDCYSSYRNLHTLIELYKPGISKLKEKFNAFYRIIVKNNSLIDPTLFMDKIIKECEKPGKYQVTKFNEDEMEQYFISKVDNNDRFSFYIQTSRNGFSYGFFHKGLDAIRSSLYINVFPTYFHVFGRDDNNTFFTFIEMICNKPISSSIFLSILTLEEAEMINRIENVINYVYKLDHKKELKASLMAALDPRPGFKKSITNFVNTRVEEEWNRRRLEKLNGDVFYNTISSIRNDIVNNMVDSNKKRTRKRVKTNENTEKSTKKENTKKRVKLTK